MQSSPSNSQLSAAPTLSQICNGLQSSRVAYDLVGSTMSISSRRPLTTTAFDDFSRSRYDKLWRISVLRLVVTCAVGHRCCLERAIYFFGKPVQGCLGLMIRVMSCINAHEPGISAPEFSITTSVIRSDGR
jgi:hypothetical protein